MYIFKYVFTKVDGKSEKSSDGIINKQKFVELEINPKNNTIIRRWGRYNTNRQRQETFNFPLTYELYRFLAEKQKRYKYKRYKQLKVFPEQLKLVA